MSAREPKPLRNPEEVGLSITKVLRVMEISQVNLNYPVNNLGSRKERKGQAVTRHLNHLVESYSVNTGDPRKDAKADGSRKARAV